MFQNENLSGACCVKPKENTVLDNVRETRDILTKTSICLSRLKSFLKVSPEEDCCKRSDIVDFYNDMVDLKTIASENLSQVRVIMSIIGLEE